ncbi:MAG: hypothetical protein K5893_05950 [Prevotella sp.]|nr:hypothetical protein [Prevotella sp.]
MAKKKKQKKQTGQQFLSPKEFVKQKARTLEIGACYITSDIEETGEGIVFVSRKHKGGRISFATYLIDIFCVGLKDSFYQLRLEDYEVDDYISRMGDMRACTYEEAHNRVYGAIDFAEEAGIQPHKSFAITKYMLEEDTEDVPLIEYEYGKDGEHVLYAHSHLEASRYLPLLKKNLGEGNFKYYIGYDGDDYYDDDDYYYDDDDDDWEDDEDWDDELDDDDFDDYEIVEDEESKPDGR